MINKKIRIIQTGIKKLENNSKNKMDKELSQRLHQIHGEMYGYMILNNKINKNLNALHKEIMELNGDLKTSKH